MNGFLCFRGAACEHNTNHINPCTTHQLNTDTNSTLTRLFDQEDFTVYCRRESFKSCISLLLFIYKARYVHSWTGEWSRFDPFKPSFASPSLRWKTEVNNILHDITTSLKLMELMFCAIITSRKWYCNQLNCEGRLQYKIETACITASMHFHRP
jgi:hypothetical protein